MRLRLLLAALAGILFVTPDARAAQPPAPPAPPAPRAASDSIQGIRIGSDLDRVEALLERFGASTRSEGEEEEESEREGKRRQVWTLARGDYETIVVESDTRGVVTGATGFVRKGHEIPFAQLGIESDAARWTDSVAMWNVATSQGGYRLLAKGPGRRARVVTLLSLAAPAGN